jgi:polyhydroxyalkanoate synthesis regulator phasin
MEAVMTINEVLHKTLMAGLGVPEKIGEVIDELVKKGELSESQGARLVKEFTAKAGKTGEEVNKAFSELVGKVLEKMNIPTRDDFEKLNRKVTALSARMKKLEEPSKE